MTDSLILVQPLRERLQRAAERWQAIGLYGHAAAMQFALAVLDEEESYYRSASVPPVKRFRLSKWVSSHINPLTNERKRP